jgi:hypothetical protein
MRLYSSYGLLGDSVKQLDQWETRNTNWVHHKTDYGWPENDKHKLENYKLKLEALLHIYTFSAIPKNEDW